MDEAAAHAKTIVVLGGYGRAGSAVAEQLLASTACRVVIAGRRRAPAEMEAARLRRGCAPGRVTARVVDVRSVSDLDRAFGRCAAAVVAVPLRNGASEVAEAALRAGIHYLDINPDGGRYSADRCSADRCSADSYSASDRISERARRRGVTFLLQAGAIPGCPSALVRWAGCLLDEVTRVRIASLYRDPAMSEGSISDIVAHTAKRPLAYKGGAWRPASRLAFRRIDFGAPFGRTTCAPIPLDELKGLPERMGLAHLAAYQAGMGGASDAVLLLWGLLGLGRTAGGRRLGTRLMLLAQKLAPSPSGLVLKLEAMGRRGRRPVQAAARLAHSDMYRATAIPVAAALVQLLRGKLAPGVHRMGHAVQPRPFLEQLERLGMQVARAARPRGSKRSEKGRCPTLGDRAPCWATGEEVSF